MAACCAPALPLSRRLLRAARAAASPAADRFGFFFFPPPGRLGDGSGSPFPESRLVPGLAGGLRHPVAGERLKISSRYLGSQQAQNTKQSKAPRDPLSPLQTLRFPKDYFLEMANAYLLWKVREAAAQVPDKPQVLKMSS